MIRPLLPLLALLALLAASPPRAEVAPNPSGHWEGTIQAPDREVRIEVDLTKSGPGAFAGTFSNLDHKIQGLPLGTVVVKGRTLRWVLGGSGGGTFEATLSAGSRSMSGRFTTTTPDGDLALPFRLTRTGDARIEGTPKSPPIRKELEGKWNGSLEVEGKTMRIVLELSKGPDHASTGSIANLDQGGVVVPITTIREKESTLTLEVKIVGGTFIGALDATGTGLAGRWTQGAADLPLSFRRGADSGDKK